MKLRPKILVVAAWVALLGTIWWLSAHQAQHIPRLTFAGFTNSAAGQRLAAFSISNAADKPVFFAPIIEVRKPDGSYERWTAGATEMPATALLASRASNFATPVPDSAIPWRLRLIWQPKPTTASNAYASTLDRLLRFFRRVDYPKAWIPSARVWHDIVITPERLQERGTEPAASPSGGPAKPLGNAGISGGTASVSRSLAMPYETQILWMKKLGETFDSIGYAGIGSKCLTRCVAAFEAGDKTAALAEYRKTIGSAANFASALSDLNEDRFYKAETVELSGERMAQMLGVMTTMSFLMDGNPK